MDRRKALAWPAQTAAYRVGVEGLEDDFAMIDKQPGIEPTAANTIREDEPVTPAKVLHRIVLDVLAMMKEQMLAVVDEAEKQHASNAAKSLQTKDAPDDCGTGAGGFKEDNTCATGSIAEHKRDFPNAGSRDTFSEDVHDAIKNKKDTLYGVPVEQVDGQRRYRPTEEDEKTTDVQKVLIEEEARSIEVESNTIFAYTQTSRLINEGLRTGDGFEVENPAETYLNTPTEKAAIEAVEALESQLRETEEPTKGDNAFAAVGNPFESNEEFEEWRDLWISENREVFDRIDAFGKDMQLAHGDLTDAMDSHGSIGGSSLSEFYDTADLLSDSSYNLDSAETWEDFRYRFTRVYSAVKDWAPQELNAAFHETGLATHGDSVIRDLDFDLGGTILESGEAITVHRGIPLDDPKGFEGDLIRSLLEEDEFTTLGYASTSNDALTAATFAGGDNQVHLRIKARTGLSIAKYSAHPSEQEILLPRDTTYRITGRKWILGGRFSPAAILVVDAEEVE